MRRRGRQDLVRDIGRRCGAFSFIPIDCFVFIVSFVYTCFHCYHVSLVSVDAGGGAPWLELRTGNREVLGSNPAGSTFFRNFDNSVYLTLPMSVVGDTKSRRSLLSGVYAREIKRSHTGGQCVTYRGLYLSEIYQ